MFVECRVTTAVGSKPVALISEIRAVWTVVNRFEDHSYHLLYDFIPNARDTKFPHLAVGLWDEGQANRFEVELFGTHFVDDFSNALQREAVEGFFICSRGHVSGF